MNISNRIKSQKYASISLALFMCVGLSSCVQTSVGSRNIKIDSTFSSRSSNISNNINKLLYKTAPSYVTITIRSKQSTSIKGKDELPDIITSGSGFIVGKNGYVVTAGHVASSVGHIVTAKSRDGKIYKGKVMKVLANNDIALIKLNHPGNLRAITPASQPCLSEGETIFSIGKPKSMGDTARVGHLITTSFGHRVSYRGFGYPDAMVLRLGIEKGESGGPVFDSEGKLIGMLVSKISDRRGKSLDIAHAIPINRIAKLLCGKTTCSKLWQSVAKYPLKSCKSRNKRI